MYHKRLKIRIRARISKYSVNNLDSENSGVDSPQPMSIARVAEAANVSYATAWRIINNRPCSSSTAIKAVQRAVRQVGYEPAQGVSRRGRPSKMVDGIRTRNIALLHFRSGTALSTAVLNAVQARLAERDLNLLIAQVETTSSLPPAVRSANVDGILGYGKFPDEAITPQLQRIPAVWMMTRNDGALDRFGDRVMPDHRAIGALAADYLINRGHRYVSVLNPYPNNEMYRQRCDAFTRCAEVAGTQVNLLQGEGGSGQINIVGQLAERWLGENAERRGTGIFVPADEAALPLSRYLRRSGVTLANAGRPRGNHVDLVSSDNDRDLLAHMHPQPQTIDLNRETIAELAVERLFWRMRHGTSAPQVTLQVRRRWSASRRRSSSSTASTQPNFDEQI